MKKKLMIITASLGNGGLERIVSNVASSYIDKGFDVYVVTIMNPTGEVFVKLRQEVKIINYNSLKTTPNRVRKLFLVFGWIKFLKRTIKNIKPDYILSMTLKIGALTCIANKTKARVTIREISDPKSIVRSKLSNSICFWFARKADSFIFQTNWEKICYPKKLQKKGYVIPNPVNLPCVSSSNTRKAIVTMGRLYNLQKRHDVLIKSFALFLKNYPDYYLEIYGNGPDLLKDIKLCDSLKITNNVLFRGEQKDVHNLISGGEIFVLTSEFEGMSNALLEAMLMGIPCISTSWPGVEDVIENGINGIIVDRDDVEQISKSMAFLASNSFARKNIALNALNERHKYDMNVIMVKYSLAIEGK